MKKFSATTTIALLVGSAIFGMVACRQSSGGDGGVGGSSGSRGTSTATAAGGGQAGTSVAISGASSGNGGTVGSGGTKASDGSGTIAEGSGGSTKGGGGTATGGGGSQTPGTSSAGGRSGMGGLSGSAGSAALGGGPGGDSRGSGAAGNSGGVASTSGATGGRSGGSGGSGAAGHDGGVADAAGGGADAAAAGGTGGGATVACPAGGAKPTEGKKTVMVGSTSRTYYLHIPAKYDGTKPAPLVVDYHGLGGNGTSEEGSNPYRPVIDPEGVVSAYPDGVDGTNGTGWNMGPCCTNVDDVAFAKALVQDVEKMACIDPKRVYAVGFSLGGGMVHFLGCKAADLFAAISPAASDLAKENLDSCKPVRPITVIAFRGTADTAVPFNGGSIGSITNIGAKATFQKWAELDQCTGSPSAEDSNGCSTYSSCAGGVQVTLCTKQGGGHDPGNASVSWPILKKYSMP